ncbi:histone deacetylase, partial [Friedmanniomyces endolithicus]
MTHSHNPRGDIHNGIVTQWTPSHATISPASGSQSPSQSNGHALPLCQPVQTPVTPPITEDDERLWRDQELNRKIMHAVESNGITRPKGHTVSFHYNSGVEDMHFGKTHPMKPWRLTLTKHLVLGYGLQYAMDTYVAMPASKDQVRAFHDPDYVDFLQEVSPQTFRYQRFIPPKHEGDTVDLGPFNLSTSPGADCPVFD